MVMSPLLPRSARHPGRHVLAALAMWAAAAIGLAKELKTFYSQEFSLEFDFNFI